MKDQHEHEKEDHQKKMCRRCGRHVGLAHLYNVRGGLMCDRCGQKEIDVFSRLMKEQAHG